MAQGCQIEGCQLAAVGQLEWFTADKQRHRVVFCAEHRNLLWDNIETVLRLNCELIKRDTIPIEHTGTIEAITATIQGAVRHSLGALQITRACRCCKRALRVGAYRTDDFSNGTMRLCYCSGNCRKLHHSHKRKRRPKTAKNRQATPAQ